MLDTIGDYRLLRCIGYDISGTVYHAMTADGRDVTLTTLRPRMANNVAAVIRFYRQARLAMRLRHPNLIQGLEIGQDGGMHFFVREFLEAETLHSRIKREGAMAESEAVHIIRFAAAAVEQLHMVGIVHCGLTPDSILITADGAVKVAGLSSAKRMHEAQELPCHPPSQLALQYMPPQQIRDEFDDDLRSDTYALGATLYTLLTGKTPFGGQSNTETLARKYRHEYVSPEQLVPELSRGVVQTIRRCLSAAPHRRPQNIAEFRQLLDSAMKRPREREVLEPIGRWHTGPVDRRRSAHPTAWEAGDLVSAEKRTAFRGL